MTSHRCIIGTPAVTVQNDKGVVMRHADSIDLSNACRAFYQSRLETTRKLKERWKETGEMEVLNKFHDVDTNGDPRRSSSCYRIANRSSDGWRRRSWAASENVGGGEDVERCSQKDRVHRGTKTTVDVALGILRREMILLMDQDLCLMRQLLTLNEEIEDLKWRRRHGWSRTSSFCSSDMLQSASSLGKVDEHPALEFLTPSSLSLQLESSHVRLSVYNEEDPTGTFNRAVSRANKMAKTTSAVSARGGASDGSDRAKSQNRGSSLSENCCNRDSESSSFSTATSKDSHNENAHEVWICNGCNDLKQIPDISPSHLKSPDGNFSMDNTSIHREETGTVKSQKSSSESTAQTTSSLDVLQTVSETTTCKSYGRSSEATCKVTDDTDLLSSIRPYVCIHADISDFPRPTCNALHDVKNGDKAYESDASVSSEGVTTSSETIQSTGFTNEKTEHCDTQNGTTTCGTPDTNTTYQQSAIDHRRHSSTEGDSESQDSGIHDCVVITSV